MAYITGNASTISDFFGYIASACQSNGWTILQNAPDAAGTYRQQVLWMQSGSCIAGIASSAVDPTVNGGDRFIILGATGHTPGLNYYEQPGYGYADQSFTDIPCVNYHFFVTSSYFYCVVEGTVSSYRHFGWGHLEKQDNYTGGEFIYSHMSWSSTTPYYPFQYSPGYNTTAAVLVAGDGYGRRWRSNNANTGGFPNRMLGAIYNANAMTNHLINANRDQFNKQVVLAPFYLSVYRANGLQSYLGYPPNARGCGLDHLGSSISYVNLGPDTWMVFPMGKENHTDPRLRSNSLGMAILLA